MTGPTADSAAAGAADLVVAVDIGGTTIKGEVVEGSAGDVLLALLRATMYARATVQTIPEIVPARFGARAGVVGAALVARQARDQHPKARTT